MIFTGGLAEKVLDGTKTQTRRLVKFDTDAQLIIPCIYQVGRTYAVQDKRGGKQLGRIKILDVRKEATFPISQEDANAEGFDSPVGFESKWFELHGEPRPGVCWRIVFEKVEGGVPELDGREALPERVVVGASSGGDPLNLLYLASIFRALADKATPGPWRWGTGGGKDWPDTWLLTNDEMDPVVVMDDSADKCAEHVANRDWVVFCDPQTIMALVEHAEKLEEALAGLFDRGLLAARGKL